MKDTTYSGPFQGTPGEDYAEAIIPLRDGNEAGGGEGKEAAKSTGHDGHMQGESQPDDAAANDGDEDGRGQEQVAYGRQDYDDGAQYMGEWVRGYRNGRGTGKWPDGSMYMGQWLEGQVGGAGKHTWADGSW